MEKKKYGLFTSIAMIVGICIGSGIFFKSDNILVATGGNVFLGVCVFIFGAISIIFGGLCVATLAKKTDKAGGVIAYIEKYNGKSLAAGFGWFQILVYYPTLVVVVSWVTGIYTDILFNLSLTFAEQLLIGFIYFTLSFGANVLSPKFAGYFQNATTVIKIIPLIIMAVCGLVFGNPQAVINPPNAAALGGGAWIAAIAPIAYSFDGWIVSTSISGEIKNAKRNLPLALTIAPILVLILYIAYFVGISMFIGADEIIRLKDAHVYLAAEKLLGTFGAKVIVTFVIISVMGTVNGLVLGYIRIPYSLATLKNMIPFSKKLSIEKWGIFPVSAALCYGVCLFWVIIHYVTHSMNLLPNSDISEISIAVSYLFYIFLYWAVLRLYKKGEVKGIFSGVITPILAFLGSAIIIYGSLQSYLFIYYFIFSLIVILAGIIYAKENSQ